ncbi:MAG: hypothetical protein WB565_04845 [Acidimicrobiales bacterium]
MRDLARLTADDFESCVGDEFDVDPGGSDPVKIVLLKVLRLGDSPETQKPFAVHFVGPRAPVLTHDLHRLVNPDFGELELFIGPVVPSDDGTTYEAVFT